MGNPTQLRFTSLRKLCTSDLKEVKEAAATPKRTRNLADDINTDMAVRGNRGWHNTCV